MNNEILLILSLVFVYGTVLIWFRLFGKTGLICLNVLVTIIANIEVMIHVEAFGMYQTLGNVLFASTFLITDILSEIYDKKYATKAVNTCILSLLFFVVVSQSWFLYTPVTDDITFRSMKNIFSQTPRMMIAGLIVYIVSQRLDVLLYHKTWELTNKFCKDKHKYLWLRNNFSTLISQLVNTVLFVLFAFWGSYDFFKLSEIMLSSYIIFIFTSIADTPVLYLSRIIAKHNR